MDLHKLCEVLQTSFFGQLNRTSNAMISKMISMKMPGTFRASQMRSHLNTHWGLGPGRQDCILLRASSRPPPNRLSTQLEAEAFLNDIVKLYLSEQNLTTAPLAAYTASQTPLNNTGATAVAVIQTPETAAQAQARNAMEASKLDTLARSLGIDLHADKKAHTQTKENLRGLQKQLDSLTAELGDEVITGVQPKWSASKARTFDSYWNWALQDLLGDFCRIVNGEKGFDDQEVLHRVQLLVNRACPRLLKVARYLRQRPMSSALPKNLESARTYLSRFISSCASTKANPTINSFAWRVLQNSTAPQTSISEDGTVHYREVPRLGEVFFRGASLKHKKGADWSTEVTVTELYWQLFEQALSTGSTKGTTFLGKEVLLIGASASSIGSEILRGLLVGGAHVIVTTSSFSKETVESFQEIYMSYGARGSRLRVVPFNQASLQDVKSLVDWIYDPVKGLGVDLDHIVPFAAIPESGREMDEIDSKSELAHRMMLINVFRLLGRVKKQKITRGFNTRITQVILPLSPNHGVFGGDGLYAESKLGLETLFAKWHSESWAASISICGAAIGWTRSTGLMKDNDILAEGVEALGIRTFSQAEMAFHVLMLMSTPIAEFNETAPIYADLTGGLNQFDDLKWILAKMRSDINQTSAIRKAIAEDELLDAAMPTAAVQIKSDNEPRRQANIKLEFPLLPDYQSEIQPLAARLQGMVDLDRTVVVTGIAEIGPYGNARTRWEIEAAGKFSLEGCIEMAWMMGMIKHHNGDKAGKHYTGWVDTKTSEPVADLDVKAMYESQILSHTGIRLVEPELDIGYGEDPKKRQFLQEIVLTEDMPPIFMSKEAALHFQTEHGDLVEVHDSTPESEESVIRFRKGVTILVPKALQVEHAVAGQIPTGWDPKVYGLPDEIITSIDRVTLFTLVSTAEALFASGITDIYELYRYIHVSEIGNCIGSGLGGIQALKKIFRSRYHDVPVQADILQEVFINTTAAWINMLLISGTGPIRTPVGACATALESLESGYELITSGKAKVCLVGGVDDMDQDISAEFANMGATRDPIEEREQGRTPKESSRPTTSSRKGFVEAHGSGVQVLTNAQLALEMGLPIYGIIAWASTASDKAGRSVPAPGKGILTNASESAGRFRSPLLDISYRRKRLEKRREQIDDYKELELEWLEQESHVHAKDSWFVEERRHWIMSEVSRQQKEALGTFGHLFWHGDPQISPIRGALAVWGLTIDDLDFASFHATSTVLNDLNETDVIQQQLSHLGRREGNILFGICQKYLTGHSKGAAAAWMLNGCLQVLCSGLIPGQRNADNIDSRLRDREFLFFPKNSIQTPGLNAFSVTSFGFGQKGAQAIGIHPKYLFAVLTEQEYSRYRLRAKARAMKSSQHFTRTMATNSICDLKAGPPWKDGTESAVLLNPLARLSQ